MVYYKYWEDGQWHLGRMNIFKAIICKMVMKDKFRFVPRSQIRFV